MRAWGCGERRSLQWAIRGRTMSSAKRVWPVTLARASTRRRGTPMMRRSFPVSPAVLTGGSAGGLRVVAMRAPSHLSGGQGAGGAGLPGDFQHGRFDGLENLQVAGAATEIAGQRFANLRASGMRIAFQERLCGDENGGRAVAALSGAEALDGFDDFAIAFERELEAGEDGLAIEENRAGTAFAEFAAVFGAGKAEILAQEFQQSFIRGESGLDVLAIEREADAGVFLRLDGNQVHAFTSARRGRWPGSAAARPGARLAAGSDTALWLEARWLFSPRSRSVAKLSAISAAVSAPPGLYQRTLQLRAPRIARVARAGSHEAKSPLRMPAAMRRRTPLS